LNQVEDSTDRPEAGEIRDRAAGGAALLGARGLLIYGFATVANLVLARLLTPEDFGVFALGLVLVMVGTYAGDGGFGGALIRREQAPSPRELEAVAGLQLAATLLVTVVVAAIAVPLGRNGQVIALMTASLPIVMLRIPSVIVLERRLDYRVIATADLVEAVIFYSAAIALVLLGLGVWGMAAAVVVRGAVGSAIVIFKGPLGPVRPRWAWHQVRPLIGFGARYQLAAVILVAREQVLSVAVGAVAGLATLGVWSLAWRVMQVPGLLFQTVGRVAFPAMSRLLESAQDVRSVLERQVATVAAVNAVVVAAVVGFAPALPALVGDDWSDVPAVLLWSGVALVSAAPIVAASMGYLLAAGEAGPVVTATTASAIAWLAVTVPLLDPLGAAAVGIGWIAATITMALMLWPRTAARSGASVRHMAVPTALALAAVGVAWAVAHQPDGRLLGGVLGLLAGQLAVFAGLFAASRPALAEVRALAGQALRTFR
jgi:O-antigen/teichoic acid export membrane protein